LLVDLSGLDFENHHSSRKCLNSLVQTQVILAAPETCFRKN